jgi:hypothetical protein
MNLPIEFWIILSALVGATIGFFGAAILASGKMRRIERKTWNQARLFYTRRAHNHLIH